MAFLVRNFLKLAIFFINPLEIHAIWLEHSLRLRLNILQRSFLQSFVKEQQSGFFKCDFISGYLCATNGCSYDFFARYALEELGGILSGIRTGIWWVCFTFGFPDAFEHHLQLLPISCFIMWNRRHARVWYAITFLVCVQEWTKNSDKARL